MTWPRPWPLCGGRGTPSGAAREGRGAGRGRPCAAPSWGESGFDEGFSPNRTASPREAEVVHVPGYRLLVHTSTRNGSMLTPAIVSLIRTRTSEVLFGGLRSRAQND